METNKDIKYNARQVGPKVTVKMIHEHGGQRLARPYLAISLDDSEFYPIEHILDIVLQTSQDDFLKREVSE